MTWHDPNKKNTKDYTVSNCGSGLRYKNHHNLWIFVFVIGAFFNKRAREMYALLVMYVWMYVLIYAEMYVLMYVLMYILIYVEMYDLMLF